MLPLRGWRARIPRNYGEYAIPRFLIIKAGLDRAVAASDGGARHAVTGDRRRDGRASGLGAGAGRMEHAAGHRARAERVAEHDPEWVGSVHKAVDRLRQCRDHPRSLAGEGRQ